METVGIIAGTGFYTLPALSGSVGRKFPPFMVMPFSHQENGTAFPLNLLLVTELTTAFRQIK